MKLSIWIMTFLLAGCTSAPKNIDPVTQFQLERYLGTWYEIVRQDHAFEEGLSEVTATYSMREDGGVAVLNRGYSAEDKAWREAEGRAYFVNSSNVGHLKVSFFGPFYGAYVIFELDQKDYQYAMISGPSRDYFWLLSRTPTMPEAVKRRLLAKAEALGFPMDKLVTVVHTPKGS
ncbi:apolipoprotein D and lipocalin family protein [Marinomonas alcarazii]|uniref:Outer membrane lipoprotein Blc n=1 Tax=Marinomonas alcarazii TaxID=491949 RepID=A0A318V668_9GAMM|nr:lipocalin family protein [Marinomonas alcarazii]PYF83321.1 apolipoprotein D and lipocalin family protein [Marinomonas alcarazii]